MAFASLALSVLTYLTAFLMLPVLIFPPIAFFLGVKSYRAGGRRLPARSGKAKLVAALPMLFAVTTFVLLLTLINTGYRA